MAKVIQFIKLRDKEKKGYMFKTVVGQLADGSTYERDVATWESNGPLLKQLSNFGEGDFVRLHYDKTKFRNIESAESADGFDPEQPKQAYTKSKGGYENKFRKDGTSRGEDTNRSAAIYLAQSILDKWAGDVSIDNYLGDLMYVATRIFNYIAKGEVVPQSNKKSADDVLAPPEV
jgi:hypothetical protein